MSSEPSAPQPLMLSPDHKWIWDGTQWQPIPDPANPTHRAVFPSWNSIAVDRRPPVAAAPLPTPVPIVRYAPSAPVQQAVPLWRQNTATGLNKYLYIGAAAVVVIIGAVLLSTVGPITLPWAHPAASDATPAASPAPRLAARTDFARADVFLSGALPPALSALDDVMGPIREGCTGAMTIACEYAIGPAQKEATRLVTVVGAATVPDCIATNYARIKLDAEGISGGLQTMQGGYDHNRAADIRTGLARLLAARQALTLDVAAAGKTQQLVCSQVVTGP